MAIDSKVVRLGAEDNELTSRWNALWQQGSTTLPVARYEHLQIWKRHFAPRQRLIAVVIHEGDRWLAALPLVASRRAGVLPVWCVPGNDWSCCGDLLHNAPAETTAAVADAMCSRWSQLGRLWTWLDPVPQSSLAWQSLRSALDRRPTFRRESPRYTIGQIRLRDGEAPLEFDSLLRTWSGNFRRQMRKMVRRAEDQGGVELSVARPTDDQQVASFIRCGFAIEDQGWKHQQGTSVLRQPEILAFFIEQAQQLARDRQLLLAYLHHQGQPIAFEYGWLSKGVYYSPKVGYDERFSHLSPGHLLRYYLVQHLMAETDCHTFDFLGPLSEATAKWATRTYGIDRIVCGTDCWWSNLALQMVNAAIPALQSLRQSWRNAPLPILR